MADILVYCDKQETVLELISKGRDLADNLGLGLSAAALGPGAHETGERLAAFGAPRVFASEDPALDGLQTDVTAEALRQIAEQAEAVCMILGSTRRGKELAARLAQKLNAGCVADVNALELVNGELVAERYAFGGATVAKEVIDTPIKVFAVMPKTFELGAASTPGKLIMPSLKLAGSRVEIIDRRPRKTESVSLDAAARIVGVGRGVARREDLALGEGLAEALGAELGCSRGVCDYGWLPEERLIGLSGVKVKPDLYVAVGVSGQTQHTVGISSARVIVAINKDKDAPIFALADYGIIGDLYQVVPALIERLKT
jgi:electron transfer flavoprotein alpha subunit